MTLTSTYSLLYSSSKVASSIISSTLSIIGDSLLHDVKPIIDEIVQPRVDEATLEKYQEFLRNGEL